LVGAGRFADVFNVAFRIPNLLRDLLAENALQSAFVPTFVKALERDENPWHFLNVIFTIFFFASLVLSVLGIIFSKQIVFVTAYGFRSIPDKFAKTVEVTRITFPFLILVSMSALFQAVLNARKEFFRPAFSTVHLNLGVILIVIFAYYYVAKEDYPRVLGYAVLIGGLWQLYYLARRLEAHRIYPKFTTNLKHPYLPDFGKLLIPVIISVGFSKITPFVNTLVASFLREGAISYLTYAYRIMQLPVGLFAVGLQTVSMPSFAELNARGMDMRDALWKSVFYAVFLTVPSSIFLIYYAGEVVEVLFQHGAFKPLDTILTAQALIMYTPHVVAVGVSKVFLNFYFSRGEIKIPNLSVVLGTIVNLMVALLLPRYLDFSALALAVSLGMITQMVFLTMTVKGRLPAPKEHIVRIWKSMVASLIALLPCLFIKVGNSYLRLLLGFIVYTATFLVLSYAFKSLPEFRLGKRFERSQN